MPSVLSGVSDSIAVVVTPLMSLMLDSKEKFTQKRSLLSLLVRHKKMSKLFCQW